MAHNPTKRVPSAVLQADRELIFKLQSLPDYNPRNPAYSVVALQELVDAVARAEEAELVAQRNYEVARERMIEASNRLHGLTMGIKLEVTAQYGDDSPAVHAIGRKQRSERRRPARRVTPAA